MRILFLILLTAATLSAQTSVPSVCIEDGMSLRSEPAKSSKFLTTVGLGEEVAWLGRTEKDAKTSQDYYDIKLSDGTTGWILTRGIVTKAKAGVIRARASVFTRPNLLNSTDRSLEALALVAILQKQSDGWMEVVEGKLDAPGGEHVWVKDPEVSIDKNDLALAVIGARAIREKDKTKQRVLMAAVSTNATLISAPAYSIFVTEIVAAGISLTDTCLIGEARVGQKFRNFTLIDDQHSKELQYVQLKFAGMAILNGHVNFSDYGGFMELVLDSGQSQLPYIANCPSWLDCYVMDRLPFLRNYPNSPIVDTRQEMKLLVTVDTLLISMTPKVKGTCSINVTEMKVIGTVPFSRSVCIEEGMSIRETPSNQSALLAKLKMGESVEWLGETRQVSGLEYWKISSSAGIAGWTLARCLVTGASARKLDGDHTGYSRLDGKQSDFPSGTMVAVLDKVSWGSNTNEVYIIPCKANDAKKDPHRVSNPTLVEDRSEKTFTGNPSIIMSVAVSPDGQFALAGSNRTIKIWEVGTAKEAKAFSIHPDYITSVACSPDGRVALSGSKDSTAKLCSLNDGQVIRIFKGHSNEVKSVVFSPDGKFALSGSWDRTLRLWDISSGNEIRAFTGHSLGVTSVAFSPDGKRAVSGSLDSTLKLWDISTGTEIKTFTGHSNYVFSVAFSPDGKFVLSGSADKTLKLWEIGTGKEIRTFTGHANWVYSVAFSPDGKFAVSGSSDKTLKLWEIDTGREIKTLVGHTGQVLCVAFSPDGKFAISGSQDKTVKVWAIKP